MILYHFTSKMHLRTIMGCGYLEPHDGPWGQPLLWLTDRDGSERDLTTLSFALSLGDMRTADRDYKLDVRIRLELADDDPVVADFDSAVRAGFVDKTWAGQQDWPRRPMWWWASAARIPHTNWRSIDIGRGEWVPTFDLSQPPEPA